MSSWTMESPRWDNRKGALQMCKHKMSRACFSRCAALSTCKTVVLVLQQAKNHLGCFLKTLLLASPSGSWMGSRNCMPSQLPRWFYCRVACAPYFEIHCCRDSGSHIDQRLTNLQMVPEWPENVYSLSKPANISCRAPFVRRKVFDLRKALRSSSSGSRGF